MKKLFAGTTIGNISLSNRIVMAPMTRARADNPDLVPTPTMAEHYAQRASAGLIITEGTWVNEQSIGFVNVPGIYSKAQTEGWKLVTKAVHAKGGKIVLQLGHVGSISHPDLLKGKLPVGPSAINPNEKSFTPSGFKDTLTPHALTLEEIRSTIADFKQAAANAKEAGFDGVEIHAQHTFLFPQFLNEFLNQRTDEYGGTPEKRTKFLVEVIQECIEVWGPNRVGVKINPVGTGAGFFKATQDTFITYDLLMAKLNEFPMAYVHLVRPMSDTSGTPYENLSLTEFYQHYRKLYRGLIIANGAFTDRSAEETLETGIVDLVSFGEPFIANPDLVERFKANAPLAVGLKDTYYQGGTDGYITYPTMSTSSASAGSPNLLK